MYKPVNLKYEYSSLEPFIDAETMDVHYNKHYIGYLNNLNEKLSEIDFEKMPIRKLIEDINSYSNDIRNNAGGYFNHSLFWNMLSPNTKNDSNLPSGLSRKIINRDFDNYDNFKKIIEAKAKKRFGSGWVWWIMMPNGKTRIVETPYQDNPLMYFKCEILLGIDVWEHAYYLKYQADRMAYVNNIFKVINWNYPNEILSKYY